MATINSLIIKQLSQEMGFSLCGITPASHHPEGERRLRDWLEAGYGAPLEYMQRNIELRSNPTMLLDGAQSVIVCAISYKSEYSLNPQEPKIASYALCRDYHKSIKALLKALLRSIQQHYPEVKARIFTDSAPLLEKWLAHEAGLGWIGRQSLLITPEYGSFVLLGEIVIDAAADVYDAPYQGDGCGECRQCENSCPVGAINSNRTIDTRRCISCRTIEVEDMNSDTTLNGWIFGCDECQICCPHNRRTPMHSAAEFNPIIMPPSRVDWERMNEELFDTLTLSTPLRRAGYQRIMNNLSHK